jgi:poly-gamma-glutamate capsule biosynthesis protein CapA/YwtB (metallophosphatase superfamily)
MKSSFHILIKLKVKNMKKTKAILMLALALSLLIFINGCSYFAPNGEFFENPVEREVQLEGTPESVQEVGEEPAEEAAEPTPPPKPRGKTRLKVSAMGDIMTHGPQIGAAQQKDGSYDFRSVFEEVKPYLENSDIVMGNLETTISTPEKGYSGYPRFKAPEELLDGLEYAGFNVLTTANNHSFDGGEFGVIHTLDKLDEKGFFHTGTARTQEERDQVLLIEKNDIKIAVLAYTYGTNGMEAIIDEDKRSYMVNYLRDMDLIREDIRQAREAGAEIIIACMHWGYEYHRKPNEDQEKMADELFAAGVDIIFGSHPHMLQPMERRAMITDDGEEKEGFVIYSLGNFVSNQRDRYKDSGIIVNVEIVKDYDQEKVYLGEIEYVPTWVRRYWQNGKNNYAVLPVGKFKEKGLTGEEKQRIQAVWKETTELIGTEAFRVIE